MISSYDLVETMAGWERLIAWAHGRQAEIVAEFAHRRPGPYAPDEAGRSVSEFAADEIAARLRISRRAADLKLSLAVDLADRLSGTRRALCEGRIDLPKARAIADHTAMMHDTEARQAVEDRALRRADSQTVPELRRTLARAVAAVDAQAAVKRRAKARAERFVHLQPLPDGMAEITALLPADDAAVVFTAVDAIAHSADPRDPRTVEARRADALVDVCRAVLDSGYGPPTARGCGRPADGAAASRAGRRGRRLARRRGHGPHVQVTVAATTLLSVDDEPGELVGYGPVPAAMARRIAVDPDATWRRLLTDPVSGTLLDYGTSVYRAPPALARHVIARDQVCVFPGCRQPAERCDVDHRVPFPHGPTCAANLGPLCRHHHRAKTAAGWAWQCSPEGVITWTAPTGHTYVSTTPPLLEPAPNSALPDPGRAQPGLPAPDDPCPF